MRILTILCALIAISVNLAAGALLAQDTVQDTVVTNPDARVTIHVLPHATRSCTKNFPTISDCDDIISTCDSCDVDFFVVFYDLDEWQGLEYGVTWEGSECTYTSCSSLTIGDIVRSGDGISHAWFQCQTSRVGIPGFGWITTSGPTRISVVAHPVAGGPNIAACVGGPQRPIGADSLGYAGVCGERGLDPCQVSTEPSTWGQIKALFR